MEGERVDSDGGPSHLYGESQAESKRIAQELRLQSDRGAGVLGASLIDAQLAKAIKSRFFKQRGNADKLLGIDHDESNSLTLSQKAKLAYCLGLIGSVSLNDVMKIATVRNIFAHQLQLNSFREVPAIAEACLDLKTPDKVVEFNLGEPVYDNAKQNESLQSHPRVRFEFTVYWIGAMLIVAPWKRPLTWPAIDHSKEFFW